MKKVKMHGKSSAYILIIGEAPGEVEMITGIPMSGPQGGVLHRYFGNILNLTEAQANLIWPNKASHTRYAKNRDFHKKRIEMRDEILELRSKHIAVTNAVNFWPKNVAGKTRRPSIDEIKKHNHNLIREIKSLPNLKSIITCGNCAKIAINLIRKKIPMKSIEVKHYDHTRNWNLNKNSEIIESMIRTFTS